jgi:hypothetical protein
MATTLLQLRTRVADKLMRSSLSSQIDESINDAIRFYQSYRFWFNEKTATFNTVASQKAYSSSDSIPTDIVEIDNVKITVSSSFYYPERVSFKEIEDMDISSATGVPNYYSYYKENFYFYLIPDSIYVVTVAYLQSYSDLSLDADNNDFTNSATKLIEYRALRYINSDILRNDEDANRYKGLELEEFTSLQLKTERLVGTGKRVQSTSW